MQEFELPKDRDFLPPKPKEQRATGGKRVFSYLPSVVAAILMVSVSSLSSLLQFNFSIKEVVWSTFIISLALRMALMFSAKWIGADSNFLRLQNGDTVEKYRARYLQATEGIDIPHFEKWILARNREEKKEQYRLLLRAKINRLQALLSKKRYLGSVRMTKHRTKCIRAYERHIELLIHKSSEEYLEEHIDVIRVKFTPLKASDFLSPSDTTVAKRVYSMNRTRENVVEISKGIPLMLFFTLLSSFVGYNVVVGSLSAMSLLIDLFSITMNFISGFTTVAHRNISKLISVYIERQAVLEAYKKDLT